MTRKALLGTTILAAASCTLLVGVYGVKSQQFTNPVTMMYLTSSTGVPVGVSTANPLPVNASVSASITGFTPGGAFATITATGTSIDTALPAGSVVAFQNTGSGGVSCNLTTGAGTATTSQNIIPGGSVVYLTVGTATHASCIDTSGSTPNLVVLSGGSGLGTGFGGGGGSGGGVVTQATAANLNMTEANSAAILAAAQASIPAGNNAIGSLTTGSAIIGALVANQTVNTAQVGGTAVVADPCKQVAKSYVPVNLATNSTQKIITGTSAKKTYICSLFVITAVANNITLVEGTTSCATPTGMIGGATAGSGVNLAANGGFTFGNGTGAIAASASTATDVCFISSATGGQYSGVVTYVQL